MNSSTAPSTTWTCGWPAAWSTAAPPFGGNLMLYRHQPGVLEQVGWSDAYEREHYNGLGIALLHVAGLPERLAVAGVHLTTVTPEAAATEAVWAADRVLRYSDHAVVIGDLNSHPAHGDDGGTAPDPRDITKDLDRTCRWHADGSPNRTVAERLVGSGLYDAAAHLARRTGLTTHYAATGRGGVRVDRAHLSRLLLDRLLDYSRSPSTWQPPGPPSRPPRDQRRRPGPKAR
ncbi:hypothetical protein ACFONH_12585 [Streptomonospora nanhaiensis]|uniref:hypothetical protein n=2 Tax=Streptomonospora nanhaiensis TaxID=1323731 RepID=UPI00360CAE32